MTTTTTPATTARGRGLAVLRLGRRTVRANGWRGILIMGLIALSVAVATLVAIGARSSRVPVDLTAQERFGQQADIRVSEEPLGSTTFGELSPELQAFYVAQRGAPPATETGLPGVVDVVQQEIGGAPILGYTQRWSAQIDVRAVDLTDPLAAGLVVTDDPAPDAGEVLLSQSAAELLAAATGEAPSIGDAVQIAGQSFILSGTVTHPIRPSEHIAVVAAGSLGAPNTWLIDVDDPLDRERLVAALSPMTDLAAPPGLAGRHLELRQSITGSIDGYGPNASIRRFITDPSVIGSVVGALLLLQVGLVAAAAFATGTRRRVRDFGLLGATGASPGQVRQLVVVEAGVLGAGGALVGALLGLGLAIVGRPLIEQVTDRVIATVQVRPLDLLAPAAVGILAAGLAALLPALTLSRTSVVTALAGRIPLRRVSGWLPAAAIITAAFGLLLVAVSTRSSGPGLLSTATLFLGVIITAAAAAALGVPLLGLIGRLAVRMPVRTRLVLRDAVRQRTRSGATVAALVAVLLVPTVLLTADATDAARFPYRGPTNPSAMVEGPIVEGLMLPVTDEMVAAVVEALPVQPTAEVELLQLTDPSGDRWTRFEVADLPGPSAYAPGQLPVLATPALMAHAGIEGDVQEALVAGDLVVDLVPVGARSDAQRAADPRRATLVVEGADAPVQRVLVDLIAFETDAVTFPAALVGQRLADQAGLTTTVRRVELPLPRPLTHADQAALALTPLPVGTTVAAFGASAAPARSPQLVALGGSLAVALLIIAMATALAATESDHDLALMVAVGAPPRLRPVFHGLQAAYHTLLAAIIAVPTGLLLFAAVQRGVAYGSTGTIVAIPWGWLAVTGLGMPALIGLVMSVGVRPARAQPLRRIA